MILYVNDKSPKKLRKSQTKKQLADTKEWLDTINSLEPPSGKNTKKNLKLISTKRPNLSFVPPGRQTPDYPSLGSSPGVATKPVKGLVYTGTEMRGIGTLHKSNAVPVFTEEEARDQAMMRR